MFSKEGEWPDWSDDGRRVAVTLPTGQLATGKLAATDYIELEDGDEAPIWVVRLDHQGIDEISLVDVKDWRYIDAAEAMRLNSTPQAVK